MTSNFFFNDTATTEIYTLSLHDALPISSWDIIGNGKWTANIGFARYVAAISTALVDAGSAGGRKIGRAHARTPVTVKSRIPSSASKKKKTQRLALPTRPRPLAPPHE